MPNAHATHGERIVVFAIHNPLREGDTKLTREEIEVLKNPRVQSMIPPKLERFLTGTGLRHKDMAERLNRAVEVQSFSYLGTGFSSQDRHRVAYLTCEHAGPITRVIAERKEETVVCCDISSLIAISGDLDHYRNHGPFIGVFTIMKTGRKIHAVNMNLIISHN